MSNLKKITEVPVVESTENINLLANSNGSAVQVAANKIGAQADWNETDEASPAFIMNKPTSLGGGGCILYGIYNGIYDADGTKINFDRFKQDFSSGIIRFSYNVPPSFNDLNIGTVIGYSLYSDSAHRVYGIDGEGQVSNIYIFF